ncbi:Uncharacterised protein [Halioglobus japonicus]|nr:Uncharacterised protein [Halioglobus japonicus]
MPDHSITKLSRMLLAAVLLLPVYTQAQSDQWYKVELLVFSRPAGATAEHWDAIPDLNYPARSQFLSYPGEEQAPLSGTSIPEGNAPAAPTSQPSTPQPSTPQAKAFATLPASQRQFSGKASAMQRSGRYRILFHEAWLQPMSGQAQTLPIILDRSGDGGPWPALQGSIKLYLSRYFYLDTNLWLNTQGEYLPGDWRMPAPPLAPASKPQQVSVYSTPSSPGAATIAGADGLAAPDSELQLDGDLEADGAYPFRHAVLLDQTRRMRSGDVVYIDHPLLGVLVTITPLAAAED